MAQLRFKPDQDGFQFEVNLIMTTIPPTADKPAQTFNEELDQQIMERHSEETAFITKELDSAMEHAKAAVNAINDIDASKAPIIEEEQFDFTISPVDE